MKYLGEISDPKDLVNKEYVDGIAGVTGVKGNSESSYRTGNVNLTPANLGIVDASSSSKGLMSSSDYSKLAGIASGAEVNQNAFSNVKVGSTTVAADAKTDTLELVAGTNITLTPDATNDKVTIAVASSVETRLQNLENESGVPVTTTWITPTITSSAITISEGGYYTSGRHCYVQMRFRLAAALSANSGRYIASAMPAPKTTSAAILSIAVNNRGGHNIRVLSDGRMQIVADVDHAIATTDDIDVTGCYTIS